MPKLRLLAYAAGTIKYTVTPATWQRGVVVSSAAAANAVPVAEFTFAAIVMIAKDVFRSREALRESRGRIPVTGVGPTGALGTRGMRVGLVGASNIGRRVIERLATLDVEVAVSDPYLDDDDAGRLGVARMELDELCAWSDVVSLHAPELPSTHHLVDADHLARMHDGAWLLNTARGSLVDTDALVRECVAGRINAFIDTPDPEPLPADSPLYDLPNVVLTPHVAGSLGTELTRLGDLSVAEVRRFVHGVPLAHEVRALDLDRIA
jgi:phosphoglycerate dehydrogenase-like enzyme